MLHPKFDSIFADTPQYHTPEERKTCITRHIPSCTLYTGIWGPALRFWAYLKTEKEKNEAAKDQVWVRECSRLAKVLEYAGCSLHVDGLDNLSMIDSPCVIAANHMSTLETFLLPAMVRPRRKVTFVVKKSLTTFPIFGCIITSCDPIALDRVNPREDLTTVLSEGVQKLNDGYSVVIFPQSTRTDVFDPQKFNSIAVKLAKRAGVPVIPLALKTNAWSRGKYLKDFGPLDPKKPVHFSFGVPIPITSKNGREEQAQLCTYIQEKLRPWTSF